jgi:xylulokinase
MDSTAETFAAGVRREGECVIRLASAGGIHGIASPPMAHRMLISYPYPMEPYWLSQAGTNTCASAVAWAYKACMPDDGNPADYTAWEALAAAAPPGSGGVLFHPYLAGERCPYWDGSLRAGFTGLSLQSGKKELARAVYEGTAFSLRDALHVLEEKGFVLNGIRLVGGGAKSALWSEIVSTVLGCAACLVPEADSSVGAALFALLGTGHFSALEEVPANLFARPSNECAPNEAWRDACEAAFARYRGGQKKLAELARP